MPPPMTAAASRTPSAEEATARQSAVGALDCVHVTPLLIDV